MSILIKLTPDFSKIWKGWSHIKVFGTGNLSYCSKPPSSPPPRQVDYRPTLKNILLDYWNLLGFYLPPFLGCGWQGFHCKGLSKTPSQLGEGSGRGRK